MKRVGTKRDSRHCAIILAVVLLSAPGLWQIEAARKARVELFFPDVPGFVTLKCDLHAHTVFSDGLLWPTERVKEAWRGGLDVLAITDHIEYKPHKADVSTNHVRSYELAKATADSLGMTLIKAAEITRSEPPGHWNALFLEDLKPLESTNWLEAVEAAVGQGAFVFWSHPGWKQPFGKSLFYKEQQELLARGWLHGMEVYNSDDYDPVVHRWCIEHGLTLLGNSDIHDTIDVSYDREKGEHRPVTLVFAKEPSVASIKEALFDRRTAVWAGNLLVGEERFLRPLFHAMVKPKNPTLRIKGKSSVLLQLHNSSPLDLLLEAREPLDDVTITKSVTLGAGKTVLLQLTGTSEKTSGRKSLNLPYIVTNLRVGPTLPLSVEIPVEIEEIPVEIEFSTP